MSRQVEKFLPLPSPGTQVFWDGCRQHKLLIQKCGTCETHQFYPRKICTSCGNENPDWVEASGHGSVVSWTVVRHPVSTAYADDIPYVIALIKLREGPTLMSQIGHCGPDEVRSGLDVLVDFEDWSEDISMPVFRISAAAKSGQT